MFSKQKTWSSIISIEYPCIEWSDFLKENNLKLAGLGICSLVFQASCSFLWAKEQKKERKKERAKERFTNEKEQITPVALLSWAIWANLSQLLFCKERQALKSLFKKTWRSKEQWEQFTLGHKKVIKPTKTYKKPKFLSDSFFVTDSLMLTLAL